MGSNNLPKLERPQLQVFVRHTSYSTGRDLADTVYRILTQIANATINANSYLRVEAVSSFSVLQRDDNRRVLFVSNFDVVRITP
jgi:3-phenylpropionate/cinnamic acid dioxygenase small subunit